MSARTRPEGGTLPHPAPSGADPGGAQRARRLLNDRGMKLSSFAAALLFVASLSTSSFAFELRKDSAGEVVRWAGEVQFVVDEQFGQKVGDPAALEAVNGAVAEYLAHTALRLGASVGTLAPLGYAAPAGGGPNQNGVFVAQSEWAYEEDAIAVSVVTVDRKRHVILDADLVFNAAHRKFKVLSTENDPDHVRYDDLQNTLTHELGHAVGLQHNDADQSAVMYPRARRGEVSKRQLAADDVAGLHALYGESEVATAQQASTSPEEAAVGCQSAASSGSPFWMLPFALLGLVKRRVARGVALAAVLVAPAAFAEDRTSVAQEFTGEVTAARAFRKGGLLFTELSIQVAACLQGACASTLDVVVPGGVEGDLEQIVAGIPAPGVGEQLRAQLVRDGGGLRLRLLGPGGERLDCHAHPQPTLQEQGGGPSDAAILP